MSNVKVSYREVLATLFNDVEEVNGLINLVDQHKNWGAFNARVPSYIVVRLVDELKAFLENSLSYPEPEAFDEPDQEADYHE